MSAVNVVSLEFTSEQVRELRRELLRINAVVPTISALIETLEQVTDTSARETITGKA